jgi:hypothetical protein
MERLLAALGNLSLTPERAATERVAPLLYFGGPETASPALRKSYYDSAARNLLLFEALDEILKAFTSCGLRPVLLKGADFARRLYPNPALRPMSDLDLWVAPDEVTGAESVLQALGYRSWAPDMSPGLSRAIRHARLYVGGARNDIAVDLHWSLVRHDAAITAPYLDWFRSRVVDGRLDPMASLLYLAAHMKLQHHDESPTLLWLSDFYLLSTLPEVDSRALFDAAESFGWEGALAATVYEVQSRLGIELPAALSAYARPMPPPHRLPGAEHAWNEFRTLSLRGRSALLKALLFPSPDYVRFRYRPRARWSWPLYYPVRWARILAGAASLALRPRMS